MINTYSQVILFDLPLPGFVIEFKNKFNQLVIPKINILIEDIEKKESNSSIVTIVIMIILIYLVKQIASNIFTSKKITNKPVTQSQVDQEIRSLGNEIKSLKNSLKKITQQSTNNIESNQTGQRIQRPDINVEDVKKLIHFYKETADDFNALASYVVDTQQTIFKELKYVKKFRAPAERTSSQGSKDDYSVEIAEQSKQALQTKPFQPETQAFSSEKKQPQRKKQPLVEQQRIVQNQQQPIEQVKTVPVRQIRPPAPPAPGTKRRVVPPPPVTK